MSSEKLWRFTKRAMWVAGWAGMVYLLLRGDWGRHQSSEDGSVFMYQVQRVIEGGPIPMRGVYSNIELGHPGPVLFWILICGGVVAKWLGVSMLSGEAVAYAGVCAATLLVAAWLVRRGTGSVMAAVGFMAMMWLLAAGDLTSPMYGYRIVFSRIWPIYAPNLGGFFITAGLAAGAAALKKGDRIAGAWAVVFAGLAVQANISLAPLGVIVLGAGIWSLARERGLRAGVVAVVVGWGGILGRLYTDGINFPVEYIRQVIKTERNLGDVMQRMRFEEYLHNVWALDTYGLGEKSLAVVILGFVLLLVTAIWRRGWALYIGASYATAVFWVAAIVVKPYHAVILVPFLPLGIGVGAGLLVEKTGTLILTILRVGRGGVWNKALGAVCIGFIAVASVMGAGRATGANPMPSYAFGGEDPRAQERLAGLAQVVAASQAPNGSRIGIVSTTSSWKPDGSRNHALFYDDGIMYPTRYELYAAYAVRGVQVCVELLLGNILGEPAYCAGQNVDKWLIVSDTERYGGQIPIGMVEDVLSNEAKETRLWFYIASTPRDIGFISCLDPNTQQQVWMTVEQCAAVPT